MNEVNYFKLEKSLKKLEERYNDYLESFNRSELFDSDKESIVESCIQRFEICFDSIWKHLKKFIQSETGLNEIPNGPKPIFRIAAENYIIEDINSWFDYTQKRIDTSHDYSEEKADDALKIIPNFINDSIILYEKMTKTQWK